MVRTSTNTQCKVFSSHPPNAQAARQREALSSACMRLNSSHEHVHFSQLSSYILHTDMDNALKGMHALSDCDTAIAQVILYYSYIICCI